jgi:uncharacterized protein YlxP (DUF503 family)
MNVGILKFSIRLPESHSLKEKRKIVKSLVAQLNNRFNVSAAEADDHDLWQMATIGVACLSNEKRYTNEVLHKALAFATTFDLEMMDSSLEFIDL